MDVAALSMAMANIEVGQQIGVKLAAEFMDNVEVQSAATIKMMEQSVNPELGQVIDVKL